MRIPVKYLSDKGDPGGSVDPPNGGEDKDRVYEAEVLPAEGQAPAGEDWKAQYVRLLADFDNFRKHARADRERLGELGKEAVILDIIPVIEHLERALQAAVAHGDKGMIDGLKMVLAELLGVLKRHGVERVPTVGEAFNPSLHEAVAVIPREGVEENTVVEEVRPGFVHNGRLLRPASVVVAQ